VILARELSENPKCVIASSPTRGLDIGAMEYVHKKLVELRSKGTGILLISEDLDEVFNLADVLAVIYKGRIVGVCRVEDTTREMVGLLMAGIVAGDA
jgi:general nucleoside transport system ATP-binding protein